MFQFTTTTLVNSNLDSSGLPRWTAQAEDTGQDPPVKGSFNFKRVNKFIKDNVEAIFKRAGYAPEYSTVTFKIVNEGIGLYRIALYLGYSGNINSFYANDMVFQGKPMWIDYEITSSSQTGTQIAQQIVANAKKYEVIYDNKVMRVTAAADVVTITAVDEYTVFRKAILQKYGPVDYTCNCGVCDCDYLDMTPALQDTDPAFDGENEIVQGRPGFGTYTQITKDLRLPTMSARGWLALNQEELPVPGTIYNQYTIHYLKKRGILGSDAVGEVTKSLTTHVFFVPQSLSSDFEAALANIGTIETVTNP